MANIPPTHIHQIPAPPLTRKRSKRSKKKKPAGNADIFVFDLEDILEDSTLTRTEFISRSADGRRSLRDSEDVIGKFTHQSGHSADDSFYAAANLGDPLPFIDLLEKEVAKEAATDPRARRYVSSVSNIIVIVIYINEA